MADPNGLFSELRRRKVFRVAAVYAVVGWALIEFADTTFPRLTLPDWTPTLVLLLVLLGFPVALVLAWALEVTPEGVRRSGERTSSSSRERNGSSGVWWTTFRITVVGAVAVLAIAGGAFVATGGSDDLVDDRVVVLPFQDHSGREDLASFGRMVAEWLTEGLARAELGQVVPTQTTYAVLEETPASDGGSGMGPAHGVALQTGAEYVVTGGYYCRGDVLEVQAQVVDGRTGRVLDAVEAVRTPVEDPMTALVAVRERVLGLVAARTRPLFEDAGIAGRAKPPSYEAYRHFVECSRLFMKSQYRLAIEECALAADSTFLEPYMWIAPAFGNLGRLDLADSVLDIVRPRRAELPTIMRVYLDHHEASLRGDWLAVAELGRELAETYGWDFYGYEIGWASTGANRPQAAVAAFERVDPTHPGMREWVAYYAVYGHALHMLGQHEQELAIAHRARAEHPGRLGPLVNEAIALAALGRTPEAEATIHELVAIPGATELGGTLRRLGEVFARYGQPEAADRTYSRALRWQVTRGDTVGLQARWERALLMLRAGSVEAARRSFETLHAEVSSDTTLRTSVITYLGVAAALQGDTATARAMEAELAVMQRPFDQGTLPYLRANILAVLGERDAAVSMLQRAFAEGRPHNYYDAIDPEFASLRGYPPFEELIRPKG